MALTLVGQHKPLAASAEQLKVLAEIGTCRAFEEQLRHSGLSPLQATGITVFQVNVGKLCNQTCRHCHVDAGPDRTERMTRETAEQCIAALAQTDIPTVDITGGAPELNPNFRWLVEQARAMNRHVMDRCNLSVLLLPSQADLATFLAAPRVEIVASLPYYRAAQTDAQRGEGIFDDGADAGGLESNLMVVIRPGIPEHVDVKIARRAAGLLLEPGGEFAKMGRRDLGGHPAVPKRPRPAVVRPNVGKDLESADLASAADRRVIVAGFNQAQGFEAGKLRLGAHGGQQNGQNVVSHTNS